MCKTIDAAIIRASSNVFDVCNREHPEPVCGLSGARFVEIRYPDGCAHTAQADFEMIGAFGTTHRDKSFRVVDRFDRPRLHAHRSIGDAREHADLESEVLALEAGPNSGATAFAG